MQKVEWDVENESEIVIPFDENTSSFISRDSSGKMTALIDADMIPYIVGFVAKPEAWLALLKKGAKKELKGDALWEWMAKRKEGLRALHIADTVVNTWCRNIKADSARYYLTVGNGNFRYKVGFSKLYKGTRKAEKPPFFDFLRWHFIVNYKAILATDCEADDLMSIEQTQRNRLLGAKEGSKKTRRFADTCIVTKDKDLLQVTGWHSNPDIEKGKMFWSTKKGSLTPIYYPEGHSMAGKMKKLEGTGERFFYAQMLMGDAVDNYGGLPRCGMVATYKALNGLSPKECELKVEEMYRNYFLEPAFETLTHLGGKVKVTWREMFLEQGRLAYMLKDKKIWKPKERYTLAVPPEEDDIPF